MRPASWIYALLCATGAVSQSVSFVNPSPAGANSQYQDDPIYAYGSTIKIQWTATDQTVECLVWQQHENGTAAVVFEDITGPTEYTWTVAPSQDLALSRIFFFELYLDGSTTPSAVSHYFNITGDASSSSSASSSQAVSSTSSQTGASTTSTSASATAASTSSAAVSTTSSAAISSTSPSGGGSSSTAASTSGAAAPAASSSGAANASSSGGGLTTGAKVGIGIGIPIAVIALVAAFFLYRRYMAKKSAQTESAIELPHEWSAAPYMSKPPQKPMDQYNNTQYYEADGTRLPQELEARPAW